MYDAGVDAVVICTEDYLRTRYAMEALERGLHVLLPKPFAYTAEDARLLRDTTAKSTATAVPALPLRYHPAYQRAKALLTPDRFGRPIAMRASVTHHLTAGPWKSDPAKAAGPEFEIRLLQRRRPALPRGRTGRFRLRPGAKLLPPRCPTVGYRSVALDFQDGAVASADFNCGLDHHFTGQELEAVAKGGALKLERGRGGDGGSGSGTVLRTFTADGEAEEPAGSSSGGSGKASELANWVDICRCGDKGAAAALFSAGCRTLEALLALQRACHSGQVEAVETI